MKIGGGLSYVVGPMGSGKSFYAVRKITARTLAGGYAVTNVRLYDDWHEQVALHVAPWSKSKRRRVADKLAGLYVYEPDLHDAMRYRLPGKGEARGLFIWDETHNDLSNRDWKNADRAGILQWATQLRKLGFEGYLLSQHQDNTEAQLRRVCNYIVRLQNQREQTRMLGFRVSPWPLFLASWHATHVPIRQAAVTKPVKVERYFLNWQRRLYDTHDLYHGLAVPELGDVNLRVLPAGGRPTGTPVGAAPDEQGTDAGWRKKRRPIRVPGSEKPAAASVPSAPTARLQGANP